MEPLPPLLPNQPYFTMGEVCRIVQVPDYTLRYWENQARLVRPMRRESGHRRYTREDVLVLLRVKELLRGDRMTLAGAKQALRRRGATNASSAAPGDEKNETGPRNGPAAKVLREIRADLRGLLADLSE